MITYIVPFLILILVVVFIHEYGHYYFARKYGVGVTDFSIGFGKEIFGFFHQIKFLGKQNHLLTIKMMQQQKILN